MASSHKRSVCPVACSLDLLGDKWTLLVIRDMLCGKSHYSEFLASPERISTNILADRIDRLVQSRLARASPSPQRAGAMVYALTERGRSLLPILEAVRDWGLANIKGTQARIGRAPTG